MKLFSWNVNGLRAVHRKEKFLPFIEAYKPDILCLQETKANPDQLSKALLEIDGYRCFFDFPVHKKGYSGVALYSRENPKSVQRGFGAKLYDEEGRTLIADYGKFILINCYFPNGGMSDERLRFKMKFYDSFLEMLDNLSNQGKKIILCGDVNTAHTQIDLSRPKANEENTGFLPEERAWIDKLIEHGFIDTFRIFNKEPGNYTWWDMKTRSRERNIGWRIDYFFVSKNLKKSVLSSPILPDVEGSDHCPIVLEIDL